MRTAHARRPRSVGFAAEITRSDQPACVFCTTVFLGFAALVASKTTGDHTWSFGEVAVDVVILLVSPVLAWVTGLRAYLLERRAVTKFLTEGWLPPVTGEPDLDLDLGGQTARLRGLASRAAFAGLVCTAALGLAVWMATVSANDDEDAVALGIVLGIAAGAGVLVTLNDAWRMAGPVRQAWIGGTDERMVVLYPHGRWLAKPYAVPARGRTPRSPEPRP